MTFSRILNAAAGAMGVATSPQSTTTSSSTSTPVFDADAEGIDRLYPGGYYGHHGLHHLYQPQNPYTSVGSDLYDDVYLSPYGLYNQGFHVKYGMADPGTGYGAPQQQPHPYHHHYPPQPYHPYPQSYPEPQHEVHHHHAPSPPVSHPRVHKSHPAKSNASAMSALTLLAFLFFLNILQSCIKEHMMSMNPTVMVMTAGTARRAALKTNVADSLTDRNDVADLSAGGGGQQSAEEATGRGTEGRTEYGAQPVPLVDDKLFSAEFGADSKRRPAAADKWNKSNRTIQATLQREVRFGKIERRT